MIGLKYKKCIMYTMLVLVILISMTACGHSKDYTTITDNDEIVSLIKNCSYSELLPGKTKVFRTMFEDKQIYDKDGILPDESWLLLKCDDAGEEWEPIAISGDELSQEAIDNVQILALYIPYTISANYSNSAGVQAKVTSEGGSIRYYDLNTQKSYGIEGISAEELPDSTSGNRDMTKSAEVLATAIIDRIDTKTSFEFSPSDFEIKNGKLTEVKQDNMDAQDKPVLRIPGCVTDISEDAFFYISVEDNIEYYDIPDSVTSINKDAWLGSNYVLIVGRNSYAEEFAKENAFMYSYRDNQKTVYVPDTVTEWHMPRNYQLVDCFSFTDSVKSVTEYTEERFQKAKEGKIVIDVQIKAPEGSFMNKYAKSHEFNNSES